MSRKKILPIDEAFAAKYRDNPRAIAEYLNDSLSTGDPIRLMQAVGDMVRSQGVTRFSKSSGMRRDTLYRIFKGEMKPAFETVMKILIALDLRIAVNPVSSDRAPQGARGRQGRA